MLYFPLKFLLWLMVQGYFRKIFFSGKERIPKDRPIVFACNHQSAFIEPGLFGALCPVTLHFITRGDVFVKKYLWFFNHTNQIPIFRFRDGFSGIRQNAETMQRCHEVLSEGGNILIFAQPGMKWEKRISPVKRGAVRMATGAMDSYKELEPVIVPLGINYTDHTKLNSDVMIKIGRPIEVKEFLEEKSDLREAEEALSREIGRQQQSLIIHSADPSRDRILDEIFKIKRNNFSWPFIPKIRSEDDQLISEIKAARIFNRSDDKEKWEQMVGAYKQRLEELALTDFSIVREDRSIIGPILFFLSAPIALAGAIFNFLPLWLGKLIARKTTGNPEFYSSVRIVGGGFLYIIYYLILVIPILILHPAWGILFAIGLPVTGFLALYWHCRVQDFTSMWRLRWMDKEKVSELKEMRKTIDENF